MNEKSCQTCRNSRGSYCLLFKENLDVEDAKILEERGYDAREIRVPDSVLHSCVEQLCVAKRLKYWQKRFIEYGRVRDPNGEVFDVVLRVLKGTSISVAMLLLHQKDAEIVSWLTENCGQPKIMETCDDTLYMWYGNYGVNDEGYADAPLPISGKCVKDEKLGVETNATP